METNYTRKSRVLPLICMALLLSYSTYGQEPTPVNFKVAFIGDSGTGSNADNVLRLILNEGADAVVHAGDMTYSDNPTAFEANINGILGANFPYFWSAGNHDSSTWGGSNGFQARGEARMNRLGIPWTGRLGVSSSFTYKGIFFVAAAPDELGVSTRQAGNHVRDALAGNNAAWSIAFWHKNQTLMQLGGKGNEAGWPVYEEARKGGALFATGHEHSYSRTHEMSNMQSQQVSGTSNTLVLKKDDNATSGTDEGRTFGFVSGLGGVGIRNATNGKQNNPWWGSTYYSGNGGQYGALFGEFNYNGDATLARFYFKDIDGRVVDTFFVRTEVETPQVCSNPAVPTNVGSASVRQNSAVVSWNAVPLADSYNVRHRALGASSWINSNAPNANLTLTGLSPNTQYEVQVSSVCPSGTGSAFSTSHNFTTLSPPDTQTPTRPAGLASSNITESSADLNWTASTDNVGVTGYDIYRGTTKIGTTATTNFAVTGLAASTSYSFSVRAKDAAGNESASSNTINVTTLDPPPCAAVTNFPYSESFESGLGDWTNAGGDDIDWSRDSRGTPSNGTGPSTGQDGAFYLYTEASTNVTPVGSPNKVALLYSPCIDFSGSAKHALQFGYHMNGRDMGSLEVLASTDGGSTFSSLWTVNGNQGNEWKQADLDLGAYSGSVVVLQFKAITGSSWRSDIAIDNVRIVSETIDTQAPTRPAGLASSNITESSADLNWTASTDNVGVTGYDIYRGTTKIGTTATTNFAVTGLTPDTSYSFSVLAKDAAGNESASSNTINVTTLDPPPCAAVTNFPYSESFESGLGDWTNAGGDDIDWSRDSRGTPSNGTGPSTGQDGAFYLYTEASTNVTPVGSPNKVALLYSPCIDFSGSAKHTLQFGYHMNGRDMGSLEVLASTDGGSTFSSLWTVNGNQGNEWKQADLDLGAYSGSVVVLQFKAITGSSWRSDIAIDNVRIVSETIDTQAPTRPAGLASSNITESSADLNWTASTDNVGVTGYDIYRGTTKIGTIATTNFAVTGLTPDTSYSFSVRAKDAAGNVSASSNEVGVKTLVAKPETVLTANNSGGDKIEVNEGQDGAQSFKYGASGTYNVTKVVVYLSIDPEKPTQNLKFNIGTSVNRNAVSGSAVDITPGSIINTSEGKSYQTVEVVFNTPVTLTSGKRYYLNFSNNSSNGKKYYLEYDPDNNYADGKYYKSHDAEEKDIRFQIYGYTNDRSIVASNAKLGQPAEMLIYPNPASGTETKVVFDSHLSSKALIEVFDLNGRKTFSEHISAVVGKNHYILNTSFRKTGLLIVKVTIGDRTITRSLVIKR